jgi:hypothetical protein
VPKESWDWSLPWNKGFCHSDNGKIFFDKQQPGCLPSGLLDVSRCQKGTVTENGHFIQLINLDFAIL